MEGPGNINHGEKAYNYSESEISDVRICCATTNKIVTEAHNILLYTVLVDIIFVAISCDLS
jgi:hypothetical protein